MLRIYVFGVQPAEPTPTWVHRVHTSSPDYRFWPQPPHLSAANFSQPAIPHSLALNSRSASKISTVATSSENFGCHALDPVWHLHLADQVPENNHIELIMIIMTIHPLWDGSWYGYGVTFYTSWPKHYTIASHVSRQVRLTIVVIVIIKIIPMTATIGLGDHWWWWSSICR